MKILFVCENYFPHLGGAEILFKNLAEGFVKKGQQATVITHKLRKTQKKENIFGVEVHRVNSLFSRYVFSFSSLFKAIGLARKHDIVQTTTFNGAFPAWVAAKLTHKPVVLTVHEVWQGKWQEITGFPTWKSRLHEFLESLIYKLPFDHYVCVSEATKKDVLKVMEKRRNLPSDPEALPKKISVISNGLDYHFWNKKHVDRKEIEELRKKYGQGKTKEDPHDKSQENMKIFFSWGRPGASKGFEYLIQAMPLVVEKFPHAILLLMFGSKEQYPQKYAELLQLASEKNSPIHFIHILESQPYSELRTIVAAADTIVVPSISEGFGYAAREAMALEKPVIVSDAGSLPEVVGGKHLTFQKKNIKDLAEKMMMAIEEKWDFSEPQYISWVDCAGKYLLVYDSLSPQSI